MKCPECKGEGKLAGFGCPGFKPICIPCDICKRTGELPSNITYDPEAGKKIKDERHAQRIVLREKAKELGISALRLSRMERGYFEKK